MFTQITEQRWTLRLWYGKYTHVADIRCGEDLATDPVKWARKNLKGRHRIYSDYQYSGSWPKFDRYRKRVRIYTSGADHQAVIDTWGDRVTMVSTPFNAAAEAELLSGITLNLREKLYWNCYRYSISFYCKSGVKAELSTWIKNSIGIDKKLVRLGRGTFFPIMYLRDESDMIMVRMAEPARIIGMTRAYTHAEMLASLQ